MSIATLASCSYPVRPIYKDKEKKTAERAVAWLHAQINAEQYGEIYEKGHGVLKSAGSKEAASAAFKEARELTGKIIEVQRHWGKVFIRAPVEVRAIYNVKCARGDFEEWLTFFSQ